MPTMSNIGRPIFVQFLCGGGINSTIKPKCSKRKSPSMEIENTRHMTHTILPSTMEWPNLMAAVANSAVIDGLTVGSYDEEYSEDGDKLKSCIIW